MLRKINNKLLRRTLEIVFLAAPVLFIGAGMSWIADSLPVASFDPADFNGGGLLVGTAVFLLGSTLAWWLRREYLPVSQLRAGEVRPHKVLICIVSRISEEHCRIDPQGQLELKDAQEAFIPAPPGVDLNGLIDHIKEKQCRCNLDSLLRAIQPHAQAGKLERLYLIGSRESHKDIPNIQRLLDGRLGSAPTLKIHPWPEGIDFENLDALDRTFETIVKEVREFHEYRDGRDFRYHERDIIIDATGGQKTTSIAAALATLRFQGLEFQYVQTGQNRQVLAFDVVTVARQEIE
ncbi:MAG: hypothetical protein AB1766_01635 [Pseudomonadota bacterium]